MFDLGWSKVIILAVVAIIVVGPKELPALLRAVGQFIAQLRRHAAEFRTQFDEAMKSTELDQIRKDVEAIKTDATASLRGIERSIEQDVNAAKSSFEESKAPVENAMGPADATIAPAPAEIASAANTNDAPPAAEPASLPQSPSYAAPSMPAAAVAESVVLPAKTGTAA